jgi:hypothetical protein
VERQNSNHGAAVLAPSWAPAKGSMTAGGLRSLVMTATCYNDHALRTILTLYPIDDSVLFGDSARPAILQWLLQGLWLSSSCERSSADFFN